MNNSKKISVWKIMLTFMKIGVFTFGSGYAMIPMIKTEVVDRYGWISEAEMVDMIAISEATPGPIMINVATFIGHKLRGVKGAVLATAGVVIPSFIWILVVASCVGLIEDNKYVQYAFSGIRAGVLVLIAKAIYTVFNQCKKNVGSYLLMIISFVLVATGVMNVIYIIISAALIGIIYGWIVDKSQMENKEGSK